MKYFFIYRKGLFSGYTTSEKMLNDFLNSRKSIKYKIKNVKEDKIEKDILNNPLFSKFELEYYQGYELTYELPVFEYESDELDAELYEELIESYGTICCLMDKLNYIKLDNLNDEREIINLLTWLKTSIFYALDDVEQGHGTIDEVIDVRKYFFKYIINSVYKIKRKKIMSIME